MSVAPQHRVVLRDSDGAEVAFDAAPQQSLVKAAARAGVIITTGCLQGRCAICRARLLGGSVAPLRRLSPNGVDTAAVDGADVVRMCAVAARSDVLLAPFSRWRAAPRGLRR